MHGLSVTEPISDMPNPNRIQGKNMIQFGCRRQCPRSRQATPSLSRLTRQRMARIGMPCDVVCLGRPPGQAGGTAAPFSLLTADCIFF